MEPLLQTKSHYNHKLGANLSDLSQPLAICVLPPGTADTFVWGPSNCNNLVLKGSDEASMVSGIQLKHNKLFAF